MLEQKLNEDQLIPTVVRGEHLIDHRPVALFPGSSPRSWGTLRSHYIGIFQGAKYDMFVVVRRNKDGSVLWNMIPRKTKDMNKLRVGELIYMKDK